MKKTIWALALLSLFVGLSVSADEFDSGNKGKNIGGQVRVRLEVGENDDDSSGRRQEGKLAEFGDDRRASSTEREERKASSTERRIEMQQGVALRKAERTAKVLNATIERLEKILSRLESRIEKVKAAGGITAESESFAAQAKVNLTDARKSVEAFLSVDLSADKAQENFSVIRETASSTKSFIRSAHLNLSKAVRALKPGSLNRGEGSDDESEKSSSTASTTSSQ